MKKLLFTIKEVKEFKAINNLLLINPKFLSNKALKYRLELLGRINKYNKV